jgi:23S rRNA (guanosine2251-2'-O)-methyltransferase
MSPARKSPRSSTSRGPKSSGAGRGPKGSTGGRPPRSPAAEKAVAARQARHAAASVRKADRPGAGRSARRPDAGPGSSRGGARGGGPKGLGGDQVEGRQAVRELLLAGRRKVREVWVASDQDDAPVLDDIAELAESLGVAVREVSRAKLRSAARTESPQGVLARAAEVAETELDELVATRKGAPAPFLLVADGITDPGNLGAVLRTAECAGVTGVVLPRHRAVHLSPTVTKSAAGSIEHLRFALVGGLPTAIRRMQEAGLLVVGLDAGGRGRLWDLDHADGPIALVLGAEGTGLSRLVRERCDQVLSIPMTGELASLNVAAAGALACFEVARQRPAR